MSPQESGRTHRVRWWPQAVTGPVQRSPLTVRHAFRCHSAGTPRQRRRQHRRRRPRAPAGRDAGRSWIRSPARSPAGVRSCSMVSSTPVAPAALTATAERTGRPLGLVRTGVCSPGGPRPGVPARGRGGRPPRPGSAAPARWHHPSPLRAALGRTLTHHPPPSHVVLNPTDEQQAAADAFHAGRRLALQAGAGTGKPPPWPRWPAPPAVLPGRVDKFRHRHSRSHGRTRPVPENPLQRRPAHRGLLLPHHRHHDHPPPRPAPARLEAMSPHTETRGSQRAVRPQSPGRPAAPDEDGADRGSAVMVVSGTSLTLTGLAGDEEGGGGDERERPKGRGGPAPGRLAPAQ